MSVRTGFAAVGLMVCAGLAGVPAAAAPTPGTWSQVTDTNGRNIDEVGLARTADGVLHVVWRQRVGPNQEQVAHTVIEVDGTIGATNVASGPWASAGNPDIVVEDGGGIRIFFAGLTGTSAPLDGVQSASADAAGTTWTQTGRVSSTTSANPEGVGAGVRADGTPVFTYAHSFALGLHTGLDPATPDLDLFPGVQCCAYHPDVAFDDAGDGYLGWYSNASGEEGLWVGQVAPTMGQRQQVPGSVDANGKSIGLDERMPIVSVAGDDAFFVAYCTGYPSCTTVALWKVGSSSPISVATGDDIEDVNIAAAPDGRIWVMWQDIGTGMLYAARSNADVTEMGGPAEIEPQSGATNVWKITGAATDDDLDLLASMTVNASIATWHTKVLPGLGVETAVKKKRTTVTVTDAGAPVKGAVVRVGAKKATTDKRGRATSKGTATEVEVSKPGYSTTTVSLEE